MYNFDISRTAMYPEEDVLVCTSTYHLVLPRTRGTGFQMKAFGRLTRHATGSDLELEPWVTVISQVISHNYDIICDIELYHVI